MKKKMVELTLQECGDVLVITFKSSKYLEDDLIWRVGEQLLACVDSCAGKKLLVDCSGVMKISSGMINNLIELHKMCTSHRVDLKICHLEGDFLGAAKRIKLGKTLDTHKSREKALESFAMKH